MRSPLDSPSLPALLGLALVLSAPAGEGARAPGKPPAATPAPTPVRTLRAAGSCMEFTPGRHLILAEVGSTGRVFRVDEGTRIETEVKKGVRLRVLYVDTPEGPVARRVLPGPAAPPKATTVP